MSIRGFRRSMPLGARLVVNRLPDAPAPAATLRGSRWADVVTTVATTGLGVDVVFQPIVDLGRRRPAGYEALARFSARGLDPSPAPRPDEWFAAAYAIGVGAALEARVVAAALAHRSSLPPDTFLSVNVEPEALDAGEVIEVFAAEGDLRGVVVEVTEHRQLDLERVAPTLDELRRRGALIAVDDTGAGHAGMQQILELRPSILKLDRALVAGIDRDEAKAALIEMLGTFAGRINASIVAEGVETPGEARRLVDLEVPLAQGYAFARPGPGWQPIDPATCDHLDRTSLGRRSVGLAALVERAPLRGELVGVLGDTARPAGRWEVLLDAAGRPVGVVDRRHDGPDDLVPAIVTNVATSPAELAHRIAAADVDPGAPAIVVGDDGGYVGVVGLRRLLAHLAGR